MSPSLDVGLWISNCWMSLSMKEVGALPQAGELLSCCCLSVWICKLEVDLGLKLINHHWCLRGVEDLLDLLSCPCPGGSTFHVQ